MESAATATRKGVREVNTILLPETSSSAASNGIANATDEPAIVLDKKLLEDCDTPTSDPMEEDIDTLDNDDDDDADDNDVDEDDVPLVQKRKIRKGKTTSGSNLVVVEEPKPPATRTPTQVPKKRRDAALLAAVAAEVQQEEEVPEIIEPDLQDEEEEEEEKPIPTPKRRGRKPGYKVIKKEIENVILKKEPSTSSSQDKKYDITDNTVNEDQCRVCMSTDSLLSLFKKYDEHNTFADMLMGMCPIVSIKRKDFMPQYICKTCTDNVKIAVQLKQQCESTEKELRSRLSRSKNKIRRPTAGYVVVDAPDSDGRSETLDIPGDNDFKVSDGSPSPEDDSEDFDFGRKPKRRSIRSRRGRRKSSLGGGGSSTDRIKIESPVKVKKRMGRPPKALKNVENIIENEKNPIKINNDNADDDDDDDNVALKQDLEPEVEGEFELSSGSGDNFTPPKKKRQRQQSNDTKEYPCTDCNQVFGKKASLVMHRKVHTNTVQINCEICGKQFKQHASYKNHLAKHKDDTQLKCTQCEKFFATKTERRRHMVDIHNEPAATHVCDKCKRAFTTEQRLIKHKEARCPGFELKQYTKKVEVDSMSLGRDLFKSVAPLTTTYWSDSFSD